MSLWRSAVAPDGQLVDALMDMYVMWREACAAVDVAYRRWSRAQPAERALAFDEYVAALNREERAAREYRVMVEQVSGPEGG
jgi:hypothetical protein